MQRIQHAVYHDSQRSPLYYIASSTTPSRRQCDIYPQLQSAWVFLCRCKAFVVCKTFLCYIQAGATFYSNKEHSTHKFTMAAYGIRNDS